LIESGRRAQTDLNRRTATTDLNGDVGGYLKPDKIWRHRCAIRRGIAAAEFPGQALRDASENIWRRTYAINTNNKLIAYGTWGKKTQPNRLDTFLIAATAAVHLSADST
jgi:hypothetical protein